MFGGVVDVDITVLECVEENMGHWLIEIWRGKKKLNDLYNSTDKNCISQLRTTGPLRSGFDDVNKQVMLSKSTLDGLSANDRGILSKPIQFYDKLKDYLVARRQMALLCKTLSLQLKLTMMIR